MYVVWMGVFGYMHTYEYKYIDVCEVYVDIYIYIYIYKFSDVPYTFQLRGNCSLARVTAGHSDPRSNHRRQRLDLLAPVASLSDRQVITCQGFTVHTLRSLQIVCLALVA